MSLSSSSFKSAICCPICGIPACLAAESHFVTTMWRKCQLFNTILWFIAPQSKGITTSQNSTLILRFECIPTNKRNCDIYVSEINNIACQQLKWLQCKRDFVFCYVSQLLLPVIQAQNHWRHFRCLSGVYASELANTKTKLHFWGLWNVHSAKWQMEDVVD